MRLEHGPLNVLLLSNPMLLCFFPAAHGLLMFSFIVSKLTVLCNSSAQVAKQLLFCCSLACCVFYYIATACNLKLLLIVLFFSTHLCIAVGNLELGGPAPIGARKANLSPKIEPFMQEIALSEQVSMLYSPCCMHVLHVYKCIMFTHELACLTASPLLCSRHQAHNLACTYS